MYLEMTRGSAPWQELAQIAKRSFSDIDWTNPIPGTSFDAAGLIALADLSTIAHRTALTGTAALMDALVLCPGIHRQQNAPELSKGELPPTAALTTGYIFRVENQATVAFLQGVGVTGQLVTITVESVRKGSWHTFWMFLFGPSTSIFASTLVVIAMLMTIISVTLLLVINDWWGVGILSILIVARLLNILIIRRRATPGWHGVPEPGVDGDLLILLSQDRWIRMRGSVDALKTVTSGQWLKNMTFFESSLEAIATMLVYISAALAHNATQSSQILLMLLLLISVGLLGVSNKQEATFYMHDHVVRANSHPKPYARRLDLAKELIKETNRHDWAVSLGMVKAEDLGDPPSAVSPTL
ncbi:MAG: hypothetical protein M1829_001645 [Trizodia sp. TS-e1964]|nr:MAG: hypothetical protein M1829_001645 [Trizodia sp. TS-e1964]